MVSMGRWIAPDQQTEEYADARQWYFSSKRRWTGLAAEKAKCLDAMFAGHQGIATFFLEGEEYKWVREGLLDLLRKHGVELLAELIEQASLELYGSKLPPESQRVRLKPFDGPDEALNKEIFKRMMAGEPFEMLSGMSSRGRLTEKIDNDFPLPFDYYMSEFARLCRELQQMAKDKRR
jgi:hypothetical protein